MALKKRPVLEAITRFKFSRQLAFLPVMQHWLKQPLCLDLVTAADLLTPVPLHPKRIKHRGFNQSLLLARTFPGAQWPGRRWSARATPRPRWVSTPRSGRTTSKGPLPSPTRPE